MVSGLCFIKEIIITRMVLTNINVFDIIYIYIMILIDE